VFFVIFMSYPTRQRQSEMNNIITALDVIDSCPALRQIIMCQHFGRSGLAHLDSRGKAGCVSNLHQRRTSHIMTKCIEINVTNIIIT
jgi:hypothetical protein